MKHKRFLSTLILFGVCLTLASCSQFPGAAGSSRSGPIRASGVIEAQQISIAPQISGRIDVIAAAEGARVNAGELLLSLEDDMLQAQHDQAQAGYETALAQLESARAAEKAAEASVQTARANLEAAEIAYNQSLAQTSGGESGIRIEDWNQSTPNLFDLPAWYFEPPENITAAKNLVDSTWEAYQTEQDRYQETAAEIGSGEFKEAEQRLADALAAYLTAEELREHQVGYDGRQEISELVDSIFDAAETELETAQEELDLVLTDPEYEKLIEARAKVSVAREHYDLARDYLYSLYTGENSFAVQAAEAQVSVASAGAAAAEAEVEIAASNRLSAEAAVASAEADLDLIRLQLQKMQISSPIQGVVLTRSVEPGEFIGAGITALTIGNLDQLTVTVYLPEDRYGQVALGDPAEVTVDSYPEETFQAEVIWIADQAEYTPRNVQTEEERQNTVYAVKLSVESTPKLKPGMPADVVFSP